MTVRAHVGCDELRRLADVDARQVDVLEDRLVRRQRPDPGIRQRADDLAELARCRRRDRQDGRMRQDGRQEALEDDEVEELGVGVGSVLRRARPRTARCWGGRSGPSRGRDRLRPTISTRRSRSGGTIAHARSSSGSASPAVAPSSAAVRARRAACQPDLDDRHRTRDVVDDHLGPGLRVERREVAGLDQDAVARTARGGAAPVSMSRLATLTNTERVTPDGAGRTASATIAWFCRSRPTWRTLTS